MPELSLQGNSIPGFRAVQGAVYLEEATEEDWVLKVIEDSHKWHTEHYKAFPPIDEIEHRLMTQEQV